MLMRSNAKYKLEEITKELELCGAALNSLQAELREKTGNDLICGKNDSVELEAFREWERCLASMPVDVNDAIKLGKEKVECVKNIIALVQRNLKDEKLIEFMREQSK